MPHCVAYQCSSDAKKKDPDISFHLLPCLKRLNLRKKWINAINRPESNLPKRPHLCSLHFEESCFDESYNMQSILMGNRRSKRRLKHDAVPTKFCHKPPKKIRQTTLNRLARKRREEALHSVLLETTTIPETTTIQETTETEQPSAMLIIEEQECEPPISSPVARCDAAVQTEDCLLVSTGTQVHPIITHEIGIQHDAIPDTDDLDQSFELISGDENDDNYVPSSQETLHTCSSQHSEGFDPFKNDQLVLVHIEQLKPLFSHCIHCGSIVELDNIQMHEKEGTLLTLKVVCINGCCYKWKSQKELKNAKGSVNMMLTSAITLSGIMYEKFQQMASLLKLKSLSHDTFYRLRRNYLFPAIDEEWKREQKMVIESIKRREEELMLAGDGRCDSPGHSAKYGTYTMLDTDTDKVVDFEVVKVMEVKNSNAMEKEGFIRTLTRIEEDCEVYGISTDRHLQIRKYMREEHKDKVHQIDPWHLSKGINKKITAAAKKKNCAELLEWSPSVMNHFWWAVDSCEGNEVGLVERFTSVIHHIVNKHRWPGCKVYKKCEHDPIPRNVERKKKWLKASSPAHQALVKIVKNKRILNDMKLCSQGVTTTMLEVYHSLYLKYLPKIQHFSYETMVAGTQLAALDHNNNVQRNQAIIKVGERQGEGRFKIKWSKVTKRFTAQPILQEKNYRYMEDIMAGALQRIECKRKPQNRVKLRNSMAPIERDHRNVIIERTMQYCRLTEKD